MVFLLTGLDPAKILLPTLSGTQGLHLLLISTTRCIVWGFLLKGLMEQDRVLSYLSPRFVRLAILFHILIVILVFDIHGLLTTC